MGKTISGSEFQLQIIMNGTPRNRAERRDKDKKRNRDLLRRAGTMATMFKLVSGIFAH